jgi:hypothetical protein
MSLGWPVRQEKDLGKPANLLQVEEALPRGFDEWYYRPG